MTSDRSTRHLTDDELVLLHAGDDDGVDRAAAEAHLAACAVCGAARDRLAEVLALVVAHADEPAPDGFERVMWARVGPRLEPAPGRGWSWLRLPRPAVAAGVLALVLAGFVAGRWSGPGPSVPSGSSASIPPAPASGGMAAAAAPDRVLVGTAGEHLERTQAVLVELLNADAGGSIAPGDRERAADLVAASRLIRQSAADAGETTLAGVLEELERVLVEIANDGDRWSPDEMDVLRARIESRDLLFRTRVVGAEMRQRVARWD